jgi:hypothetical protein
VRQTNEPSHDLQNHRCGGSGLSEREETDGVFDVMNASGLDIDGNVDVDLQSK